MQIYLVGGAVRDQLLGRSVAERDWVVTGATPEIMLALGYKPVGKDFPVFLHPDTHEEYALARTERKTGKGYHGFVFHTAPDVTLEQDLARRDLTINAIAESVTGEIIDPYNGQADLKACILRHVSPAFGEDPVRILRVARFAARFSEFQIHPDTVKLMRQMTAQGEVDALVPERVWQELARALCEPHPERFFRVLQDCGALAKLFPELNLSVITPLCKLAVGSEELALRFAIIFSCLDEKHCAKLCARYRIPKSISELALLTILYFPNYQSATHDNAEKIYTLFEKLDALRRPERLQQFLKVCALKQPSGITQNLLNAAFDAVTSISIKSLGAHHYSGVELGAALRRLRIKSITATLEKIRGS